MNSIETLILMDQDFINAVKDYICSEYNRVSTMTGHQQTEEYAKLMEMYIEHSIPRYVELLKRAGVTDVESLAKFRQNIDRQKSSGEPSVMDEYLGSRKDRD